MSNIKPWVQAFRLRTLPLALSSIILGGFLAAGQQEFSLIVTGLAVITTILLQVLSNLANDYGDFKAGTDNENRIGPQRTVQGGLIRPELMKRAIIVFTVLSLISGIILLYVSFKNMLTLQAITLLLIGLLAIAAAIKYTIGKNAFGYYGFGDIMVFIFFGLVGVMGTYFLNTQSLQWDVILPAASVGLLSVGVLNLNNMRDIENDKISGKNTIAVKIGLKRAKIYQVLLVMIAFILAIVYNTIHFTSWFQLLFFITMPLFTRDLIRIIKTTNQADIDPFLKKQSINTLLFSLSFGIGLIL